MHYYQFNIGDYASHTSRLSLMEDLAYRRILDLYYLSEQPLIGDVSEVAREIGLMDHVESVDYVLSKFFTKDENVFRQKRIDLEIKKYKSNAKNKSKAGKASAKARQVKASSVVTGVEQVLNTETTGEQLNINHKPITNNHKPIKDIKDMSAKADSDQVIDHGDHSFEPKAKATPKSKDSLDVYQYWVEVMRLDPGRTKPTPKRMRAVAERLKQGYSVFDIQTAIYNCSQDPWSMGSNDRNKPFNDLELICRTGEKLESYFDKAPVEQPRYGAHVAKTIDALNSMEWDDEKYSGN